LEREQPFPAGYALHSRLEWLSKCTLYIGHYTSVSRGLGRYTAAYHFELNGSQLQESPCLALSFLPKWQPMAAKDAMNKAIIEPKKIS
jgi:hypothetical protein